VRINSIADYVSHPKYKVIKPHGSVDWGRPILGVSDLSELPRRADASLLTADVIERAGQWRLGDDYELVRGELATQDSRGEYRPLFPALAIPVQAKGTFECPKQHLECLGACLDKMTKLLVIGWRAREQHFLQLVRENVRRPPLGRVVAGSETDAAEIASSLGRELGPQFLRHTSLSGEGFSRFVAEGAPLEQFLCFPILKG
jgi:hypothetical protein